MTATDLFPEVKPHLGVEDDNQRFTIRRAVTWCKSRAGVTEYDVDVAACEESHQAPSWYGWKRDPHCAVPMKQLHDGLLLPWYGDVFCNPPWDNIGAWALRAWKAWSEPVLVSSLLSISMLLPGNRTHRPWWQEFVEPFRDAGPRADGVSLRSFSPPERFPYGSPGNPEGVGVSEPNFTSVLLVWRRR